MMPYLVVRRGSSEYEPDEYIRYAEVGDNDDFMTSSDTPPDVTSKDSTMTSSGLPVSDQHQQLMLFGVVLLLFLAAMLLGVVYAWIWYLGERRSQKSPPRVG